MELAVRQDFPKSMGGGHWDETPSESPSLSGVKENPCLFRTTTFLWARRMDSLTWEDHAALIVLKQ